MVSKTIAINQRLVGPGCPCYVVAEMSANHNGDLGRALEIVAAAADAGADAIKFQTYTADTMTMDHSGEDFVIHGEGPWSGRTLYDLYEEAHTPWEWHERLFEEGRSRGIDVFSTPFDKAAVELLESLDSPAYKVASFELVDDALVRRIAQTGKPLIMSIGMATLEEVVHALGVARDAGAEDIILLRCTSSYPASDASMRLATIPLLAEVGSCLSGLSDHSLGITAPIVAVTLGACLVEKHLTLNRTDGGIDSHFSLEPAEFEALVKEVRRAEAMIGAPCFGPGLEEEGSVSFRRSLYLTENVNTGDELTIENVRSIRPGFGISPRYLDLILGRRVSRAATRGTPLSWDLVFP